MMRIRHEKFVVPMNQNFKKNPIFLPLQVLGVSLEIGLQTHDIAQIARIARTGFVSMSELDMKG